MLIKYFILDLNTEAAISSENCNPKHLYITYELDFI